MASHRASDEIEHVLSGEALDERTAEMTKAGADGGEGGATLVRMRKAKRRDIWLVLIVLVLAIGGLWAVGGREDASDRADQAGETALSLAEQIQRACASGGAVAKSLGPACGQANDVVRNPEVVRGERGPRGAAGAAGATGATGPRGPKGDPGPAGKNGAVGPAGPTGAAGAPGPAGADGAAGPAGPAGAEGAAGPAGADGVPGKDGQPPAGWTFTDATGTRYTCTRTQAFDPAAPQYVCAPEEQPGPLGLRYPQ